MDHSYTGEYFQKLQEGSAQSAREIIPLLLAIIRPKSVIDVGCATGAWLSVFKEYGIEDIWGVDGHYITRDMLMIDEHRFLKLDLSKHFVLGRKADLVVSLEVAEHLPSESADTFIRSLVRIGPLILFSAAIPGQGGTDHLNEQWPDYWAALFKSHGYLVVDCLREKIWLNERIKFWFRQNILLYVERGYLESCPSLKMYYEAAARLPLSLVHPELYLRNSKR